MNPQRWREIEDLYHAALEREPAARAALLEKADPELRSEVESLLAQTGSFPDLPEDPTVSELLTGRTLGPYRIEALIGAGGMGRVYRATDTRLHRTVAIKLLPQAKMTDPKRRRRFLQEARAASALNHPNIVALYDIASDNTIDYLVMEYVPGKSLDQLIPSNGFPLADAISYGTQTAGALAAAHAAGIVHRDIKPGNIILTPEGKVKVLDFGLAKLEERAIGPEDETLTVQSRLTEAGMVMGTPAYMAPEQKAGKPGDARTDLYSFGRVLYQMVTGSRDLSPSKRIPLRRLEKIIDRCLEEDPARRWQSAADIERELKELGSGSRWKLGVWAAAATLALAAGAYLYLRVHPTAGLTDRDSIVLADFNNKTGDPVFDDTLRQGLSVELQQSPFLSLISDQQVQATLALMGQAKDARLTPEIAQQVCERTGSAATLEGSISSLGNQYVLGLSAKNCNTGTMLDQEQIQVTRREDILNSLSQIARKFRARVGESLATVERHSKPLPEATTASLEALKAYSAAYKIDETLGSAASIPFFRRAVEIDPQFAVAWADLGLDYGAIGDSALSAENTTRAWQLRDRVTDRERFYIDFTYERQTTGNLEKAYQTLEEWWQTYPRGQPPDPESLLGGLSTNGTGRFERAIEVSQKEITDKPDVIYGYDNLASSYFLLGRFAEAEGVLDRASEHKVSDPEVLVLRYSIAALSGDQGQMDRVVALTKGQHETEQMIDHAESLALARSGRLEAARRLSDQAVDLALQAGELDEASIFRAARAVWEALYGKAADGKGDALKALDHSKGRDVQYAAGLALAFSGDTSRSEAIAGDLEKRLPEDTFVKFTYAPVLHALASLAAGKPADSVEGLQIALQYEFAADGLDWNHPYLGGLHSAYVRGMALFALRRYPEAAAEFQKILDHRGLAGLDPIGALAHLQLGRALAASGDKDKARSAYQHFLTLWKDADPDIAISKQAKSEYARLQP